MDTITAGKLDSDTIIRGATQIIERAVKNNVTVIHIEPQERSVIVRYRSNGLLYIANKLPSSASGPLARYFKKKAKLDKSKTESPQLGDYELEIHDGKYKISVATLPVIYGEKITLNLAPLVQTLPNLKELGFWGQSLIDIKHILAEPHGLVAVAGNSVVETNKTLGVMLDVLGSSTLKLVSIGDNNSLPRNVKKIYAKPDSAISLAKHALLASKQNFDILALDRAADHEAVESVMKIATYGKLVLTGVPGDTAVAGLVFLKRGAKSSQVITLTRAVIGQFYVRGLCTHCRESYAPTALQQNHLKELFQLNQAPVMKKIHELEKIAAKEGLGSDVQLSSSENGIKRLYMVKRQGCRYCDFTGYNGQVCLVELCIPNDHIKKLLANDEPINQLQDALIKEGMVSMKVDSLIKAMRGLIEIWV